MGRSAIRMEFPSAQKRENTSEAKEHKSRVKHAAAFSPFHSEHLGGYLPLRKVVKEKSLLSLFRTRGGSFHARQ